MICKVITSFCGAVNGTRGQVIDLTDEQAEDLKRAGYVVPVAGRTPTVTKDVPAEETPAPEKKPATRRKKA